MINTFILNDSLFFNQKSMCTRIVLSRNSGIFSHLQEGIMEGNIKSNHDMIYAILTAYVEENVLR